MGEHDEWVSPGPGSSNPPGGDRTEETIVALVRLIHDLRRGRDEFRRAYGLPSVARAGADEDPAAVARRLLDVSTEAGARRLLQSWVGELMLHQAALLEGYQAGAQAGTRAVLDRLDPAGLAAEVREGSVRMGLWRLAAQSGPLLQQAVWEEYLRRFRELRKMDPSEYERFSREGFRTGYEEFHQRRASGATTTPAGEPEGGSS